MDSNEEHVFGENNEEINLTVDKNKSWAEVVGQNRIKLMDSRLGSFLLVWKMGREL